MSRNGGLFSAEEISILQQNPYTKSVDSRNLFTTKEFKEEFLKQYLRGDKAPREIVSDLGYDPAILGRNRIVGIRNHIVQTYKAGEEFVDGGYRGTAKILQGTNIDSGLCKKESSQIKQLRNEICLLRQELAFLKKLTQTEHGKQQEK